MCVHEYMHQWKIYSFSYDMLRVWAVNMKTHTCCILASIFSTWSRECVSDEYLQMRIKIVLDFVLQNLPTEWIITHISCKTDVLKHDSDALSCSTVRKDLNHQTCCSSAFDQDGQWLTIRMQITHAICSPRYSNPISRFYTIQSSCTWSQDVSNVHDVWSCSLDATMHTCSSWRAAWQLVIDKLFTHGLRAKSQLRYKKSMTGHLQALWCVSGLCSCRSRPFLT